MKNITRPRLHCLFRLLQHLRLLEHLLLQPPLDLPVFLTLYIGCLDLLHLLKLFRAGLVGPGVGESQELGQYVIVTFIFHINGIRPSRDVGVGGLRTRCRCRKVDRKYRGSGLVMRPIDRHRDPRVVVFETRETLSPELAGPEVAAVEFVGEVQVYSLDIFGEDGGAGTCSYVEKLCRKPLDWERGVESLWDITHFLERKLATEQGELSRRQRGLTAFKFRVRLATFIFQTFVNKKEYYSGITFT